MYGSLTEWLKPNSLDHAIEAHLTGRNFSDLVITRANILEIFSLDNKGKVQLVSRHSIASRIIGIERVPNHSSKGLDRLLLSFPSGKYSVVEYNQDLCELTTISLHNFGINQLDGTDYMIERESSTSIADSIRMTSVDGEGRCSIVRVSDGKFAIIPIINDEDNNSNNNSGKRWLRSLTFHWKELDEEIKNVIDFHILPGYLEPTLAILYEPRVTWPYCYAKRKDTIKLSIFTIDMTKDPHSFTKIAHYDGLPSDIRRICCLKSGPKGILLPGSNVIIHIDPAIPNVISLALNSYAGLTTELPGLKKTVISLRTTMEKGSCVELGKGKVLINSDSGEIYQCQIQKDGGGRRIVVSPFNNLFDDMKVRLMTIFCKNLALIVPMLGDAMIYDFGSFLESSNSITPSINDMMDLDDIYQETSETTKNIDNMKITDFPAKPLAKIPVHGPASDTCVGGPASDVEIITANGFGDLGNLYIYKTHLPLTSKSIFQISNCLRVFPIGNKFFIVSSEMSSLALQRKKNDMSSVQQISTAIVDSKPTYAIEITPYGIVQVTSSELRLLTEDLSMVITDYQFNKFIPVLSAKINGATIVVQHEDGTLSVFQCFKDYFKPIDFAVKNSVITYDLDEEGLTVITKNETLMIFDNICNCILSNGYINVYPIKLVNSNCENDDLQARKCDVGDIMALTWTKGRGFLLIIYKSCGLIVYKRCHDGSLLRVPLSNFPFPPLFSPISSVKLVRTESGQVIIHSNKGTWLIGEGSLGHLLIHATKVSKNLVSLDKMFGIYDATGVYSQFSVDPNFNFDNSRPFVKLEFDFSIKTIVYHSPTDSYAMLCCSTSDFDLPKDEYAPISDNSWPPDSAPKDPIPPKKYTFSVKLLSRRNWKIIDEFEIPDEDYGVCLVSATLETKQTSSGRQPFLALGTCSNKGEDRPARGKVYIFDIIHIVPEFDKPENDIKLKQLTMLDMKGPVSAMCHLNGHLIVAAGPKVVIHSFENNETLTGIAFVDVGVYNNNLSSFKSFFLSGDFCKSVSLHVFQAKPTKIVTLARDYENRCITSVDWCVQKETGDTWMVASDIMGDLHIFAYSAGTSERLIPIGSVRLNDEVLKIQRLLLSNGDQGCLISGLSGSIHLLSPLKGNLFRQLYSLQLRLCNSLPHPAGINPRARPVPFLSRTRPIPRNLLDLGESLGGRFFDLPRIAKEHLCRDVLGNNVETVLKSIVDANEYASNDNLLDQ